MKKEVKKLFIWVFVLMLWFGLYGFLRYQITMYYSKLGPKQFEDDSVYSVLQTQDTVQGILKILFYLIIFFIGIKLWKSVKNLLES